MTYLKLFLTTIFWGGTFTAGKLIAGSVHPYSAAFLRFSIASFFLFFLLRTVEGKLIKPAPKQWIPIILLGLTGIFTYNLLFFEGLTLINANRASLIIAMNPVFISIFSALIFKEKLNILKIIGLIISVTGAVIVISNGELSRIFDQGIGKGELAIFGCVLSWVAYSILGKTVMEGLSPLAAVSYSSFSGTLMLFIPAVFFGEFQKIPLYTLTDWTSLFYLGIFGTVLGFFWYYEGIKKIGPMKAGIFINFVPISAIILAFIILKEPIGLYLCLGALLVITGVFLTNASEYLLKWGQKTNKTYKSNI
ncbi:MAG: EamA family transporter [Desulfobacteraceae bacterium]|nr:EamA family transporter [Desulfobacteraceae bacterium]